MAPIESITITVSGNGDNKHMDGCTFEFNNIEDATNFLKEKFEAKEQGVQAEDVVDAFYDMLDKIEDFSDLWYGYSAQLSKDPDNKDFIDTIDNIIDKLFLLSNNIEDNFAMDPELGFEAED